MSYDIYLREPVTEEIAIVPGHLMIGGTYKADYHPETGTFTPALNTKAQLNITYNYSRYYEEVYEEGIEKICGMTGGESIVILENIISILTQRYQKNGKWIISKRNKTIYFNEQGDEINGLQILIGKQIPVKEEVVEYQIDEGESGDYWLPTATNAIKPLHQLIALAKMRPDCIWEVA